MVYTAALEAVARKGLRVQVSPDPPNKNMDSKQKRKDRERKRADNNRKLIEEYKLSNGCVDCGYNEHPAALEFDHLPGYIKVKTVASFCYSAWAKIQEEIDKCEVVCSNCHSIRSASRKWHKK